MKEIVVGGVRSTGKLHLGNYFGAVVNFVKMQHEFSCYFFIADYHSLTTHPRPADLHANVRQVLAEYLACGIDPEACALYMQSDLPEIPELYMFLNMNAYKGELERVASFKEKIRTQPDNVNAGLLTYPVLMTADILMHKATKVPVGKDQEQHLEMARTFGNRFNRIYESDFFPEPQAFNYGQNLVKVPGLGGKGKMSKSESENFAIFLADTEDLIRKKVMRAVTDSGPTEPNQPVTEPVQNLFDLMKVVSSPDTLKHFEDSYSAATIRYGDLKKQLAEDMVTFIAPFQLRIDDMISNGEYLAKVAKMGADKAQESASKTMKEVREIIGFRKFY
jgi:tryptophanyl-tRNA synthetase